MKLHKFINITLELKDKMITDSYFLMYNIPIRSPITSLFKNYVLTVLCFFI